jgi:hypothetical protein
MESIMERFPAAQMACLFLLRLMVLRDNQPAAVFAGIVRAVVRRLQKAASASVGVGDVDGNTSPAFSSVPSYVMGLCTLSNLISHEQGLTFVFKGVAAPTTHVIVPVSVGDAVVADSVSGGGGAEPLSVTPPPETSAPAPSNATAALICDVIDVAMGGLTHPRAEIRQISATIAYNISLSCAHPHRAATSLWDRVVLKGEQQQQGKEGGIVVAEEEREDECLHQHLVQIMCGCVESITAEVVPAVRKRELATVCTILRSYGAPAAQLLDDLGAAEVSAEALATTAAGGNANNGVDSNVPVRSLADLRLKLVQDAARQRVSSVPADDELTIVSEILQIVANKAV